MPAQTPNEDTIIGGRRVMYRKQHYCIVDTIASYMAPCFANPLFRVLNLETGVESQLYDIADCIEILNMALAQQLLGSFQ